WTRSYDQTSRTVSAHKRFGTKRYDTSDFWPDKPGVEKAQSFVIRNGGNMFLSTRINDALAQMLIARGNSAVDWQAYSPCIYYLNGQYMGIGDLRERSNEDYVASNYTDDAGDELEDIDMIENWDEVKAGSMDALDEFQQWYNRPDVTLDGLRERMDVDNFIDQLIIHWFGGNRDFFNNNIVCWRPTAEGGRWRWLLKDIDLFANTLDLDMSQKTDYYDYAETMYEANPARHRLFRLFYAELPEARDLFIDRMLVCMGDMLQPASVKSLVEELVDEIINEYPRHLSRYFTPERAARLMDADYIGAFPGGTRFMANDWAVSRSVRMYSMLQSRYDLGDRVYMKVNRGDCTAPVTLQGYTLTQPRFSGQWFSGREIRLAVGPGYGIQVFGDGKFINEYAGSLAMMPPAGVNSLDFYIVSKASSGVESIEADADAPAEYYTLQGVRVQNPEPGLYIRRQGTTTTKVRIR
ncbi:MAG: CotH kinase family protein, partial [Muribaculum sp.]|nr:CotH kinase family protein [Muribaculum sp.]